jgi:hypothetical protein
LSDNAAMPPVWASRRPPRYASPILLVSRHENLDPFHCRRTRQGTSGRSGPVFNPATGEIAARVPSPRARIAPCVEARHQDLSRMVRA